MSIGNLTLYNISDVKIVRRDIDDGKGPPFYVLRFTFIDVDGSSIEVSAQSPYRASIALDGMELTV